MNNSNWTNESVLKSSSIFKAEDKGVIHIKLDENMSNNENLIVGFRKVGVSGTLGIIGYNFDYTSTKYTHGGTGGSAPTPPEEYHIRDWLVNYQDFSYTIVSDGDDFSFFKNHKELPTTLGTNSANFNAGEEIRIDTIVKETQPEGLMMKVYTNIPPVLEDELVVYYTLEKSLDGLLAKTKMNRIRFKFHEFYNPSPDNPYIKIFDWKRNIVKEGDLKEILYGDNFYALNTSSMFNGIYTLEVTANKNEVYKLRFMNIKEDEQ